MSSAQYGQYHYCSFILSSNQYGQYHYCSFILSLNQYGQYYYCSLMPYHQNATKSAQFLKLRVYVYSSNWLKLFYNQVTIASDFMAHRIRVILLSFLNTPKIIKR